MSKNIVIDAANGRLFDDDDLINDWCGNALANRVDEDENICLDEYRLDSFGRAYSSAINCGQRRVDSFGGDGFHFARQLEFKYAQILEEKTPVLNGMALFPVDSSVPVGARTHNVTRESIEGEAIIYRGGKGDDTPQVSVSRAEEDFPVRHVVSSFTMNMFDEQSSNFANTGLFTRKMRALRKVIERKMNTLIWEGSDVAGLFGIRNYPWMAKRVSALVYDGSATAEQYLEDLSSAANFAAENSQDVFSPNVLVITSRVDNMLRRKNMGNSTDTSIMQYFLANQNYITRIVVANELIGYGPNGEDGFLFYRDDLESVANVLVTPFQMMPAERKGFQQRFLAWSSTGGSIQRDTGNNLLMFAQSSAP